MDAKIRRCEDVKVLLQEADKVCCIEDVRKYKHTEADRLSNTDTRRETCLHILTHRHTHKPTHTEAFTRKSFYTQNLFYTQTLLHTDALHTEAFTHRRF